jgi:uncharacterized membrane protein
VCLAPTGVTAPAAVPVDVAKVRTDIESSDCQSVRGLGNGVRLLIPVFIFAAIYLYGMFDQAPSNGLTNFESNLFVFLAPAILLAVGLINVYGLWKSRRSTSEKA